MGEARANFSEGTWCPFALMAGFPATAATVTDAVWNGRHAGADGWMVKMTNHQEMGRAPD